MPGGKVYDSQTNPPQSCVRIAIADIVIKVIDASALAAVLFAEAAAEEVAAQVDGYELVAPALIDFELVNICITKIRRMPDLRVDLLARYAMRQSIRIETMEVDHTAVLALAQRTGLTGCDASYLHLARTLEVELVTLDRQLAEAAEKFL
jgi:predicted nucleic acid-binding protein